MWYTVRNTEIYNYICILHHAIMIGTWWTISLLQIISVLFIFIIQVKLQTSFARKSWPTIQEIHIHTCMKKKHNDNSNLISNVSLLQQFKVSITWKAWNFNYYAVAFIWVSTTVKVNYMYLHTDGHPTTHYGFCVVNYTHGCGSRRVLVIWHRRGFQQSGMAVPQCLFRSCSL